MNPNRFYTSAAANQAVADLSGSDSEEDFSFEDSDSYRPDFSSDQSSESSL